MVVVVEVSFSVMIRGGRIGSSFQNRRGAGRPCRWTARLEVITTSWRQTPKATLGRSKSMVLV